MHFSDHSALVKKEFVKERQDSDCLSHMESGLHFQKLKKERKGEKLATKCAGPKKICPFVIPPFPISVANEGDLASNVCPYISMGCRYSHDLDQALREKPNDIPGKCPVLTSVGCCSAGPLCRWASSHSTLDVHSTERVKDAYLNNLTTDLRSKLYKQIYPFEKTDTDRGSLCSVDNDDLSHSIGSEKSLGHVTDEDMIKLRPVEKKSIDFMNKLYLAPLTTVGNLPFRRVCKRFGAEITCGEMALASSLLKGKQSEWALLRRHCSEDLFGVQICGSQVEAMARAAQLIDENCQIDFLDINCGCPIDSIWKRGGGAGLLNHGRRLEEIIRQCTRNLKQAVVTVKMRCALKEKKNMAHQLIPGLYAAGASLITVHGRSREQRYTHLADWDYLKQCVDVARPHPLFGNGDVLCYEDYVKFKDFSGAAGVMIGRGALIKPWLFTEIREARTWDISASERLDILRDFTNYGLELWGSDFRGVETTRRFLLEWLSFLYRYIPYGILERVPQRINERPPTFVGRNDLETLMASPRSTDWIRISEMLLGPTPDGFAFTPKHKANAY